MQLTPRYHGPPPLSVDVPVADLPVLMMRQRRRLAHLIGTLADEQWAAGSRCGGWSVQDVIAHLNGVNRFWALSIRSGLAGEPTRFLASFDPVATPEQMVDAMRTLGPAEVLAGYGESLDDLEDALDGVDEPSWSKLAEAPPGHVTIRTLVFHALWDGWIHERDIVLPLGLPAVEEPDEIVATLLYAAILGPALMVAAGPARTGTLVVETENPTVSFVVDVGETVVARPLEPGEGGGSGGGSGTNDVGVDSDASVLKGQAVTLAEALSLRGPFDYEVTGESRWMVDGLAEYFAPTA